MNLGRMGGIPPKKTLGGENWKSLLCIVPAELDATSDNRIRHSLVVGSGISSVPGIICNKLQPSINLGRMGGIPPKKTLGGKN
jgi:hypothetical protein